MQLYMCVCINFKDFSYSQDVGKVHVVGFVITCMQTYCVPFNIIV